jgi:hypothetical protein
MNDQGIALSQLARLGHFWKQRPDLGINLRRVTIKQLIYKHLKFGVKMVYGI